MERGGGGVGGGGGKEEKEEEEEEEEERGRDRCKQSGRDHLSAASCDSFSVLIVFTLAMGPSDALSCLLAKRVCE